MASQVQVLSDTLETVISAAKKCFITTLEALLGPNGLSAKVLSINVSRHLGESISFQLSFSPSALREKSKTIGANNAAGPKLLRGFELSRDNELQTKRYSECGSLHDRTVFSAELTAASRHYEKSASFPSISGDPVHSKKRPSSRIVDDSDDDETHDTIAEAESRYQPKMKRLQPLASEICLLSRPPENSSSGPNFDKNKLVAAGVQNSCIQRDFACNEPNDMTISINDIKRPFYGEEDRILSNHFDAVEMEHRLDNPLLAYAQEIKGNKSETSVLNLENNLVNPLPPKRNPLAPKKEDKVLTLVPKGAGSSSIDVSSVKSYTNSLEIEKTIWKCRMKGGAELVNYEDTEATNSSFWLSVQW